MATNVPMQICARVIRTVSLISLAAFAFLGSEAKPAWAQINPMPITNQGTIVANQSSPLLIHPDASGFTNTGQLVVNPGSTLNIASPFNTLTGGGL